MVQYRYTGLKSLLIFSLFICSVLAATADEASSDAHDLAFHSDDFHLTGWVNQQDFRPFSTSVDTAQMLMDRLGFEQPILNVPLNRSFQVMDNASNVCVINKIETPERRAKYHYSLPLNFFHTQQLFQLSRLEPVPHTLLDQQGAVVSISEVLQHYRDAAIVLPRNYSYGERIDIDLKGLRDSQVIELSNEVYYARFMQLFVQGRADFALIFPSAIYRHFGDNIPLEVRRYPIANNPRIVSGHIICPNTDVGQNLIQSINQIIAQLYREPAFLDAHTKYFPQDVAQSIREAIQTQIQQR